VQSEAENFGDDHVSQVHDNIRAGDSRGQFLTTRFAPRCELCPLGGEHSRYCLEEWGANRISDNFTPRGQSSLLGSKFAPRGQVKNGPLESGFCEPARAVVHG
jgi:hypothetical protein